MYEKNKMYSITDDQSENDQDLKNEKHKYQIRYLKSFNILERDEYYNLLRANELAFYELYKSAKLPKE